MNDPEIDSIISELKESAAPSQHTRNSPSVPNITDETVGTFIYSRTAEMIEMGMESLRSMQNLMMSAATPEEIGAYSKLVTSVAKNIDSLNKIHLQHLSAKNNIDIKMLEIEANKKLPTLPANGNQTNNFFIGNHEDAMKIVNKPSSRNNNIQLLESDIIDTELLEDSN